MKAPTLKGKIEDYLNGLTIAEKAVATPELTKFYTHATGICCLTPKLTDRGGCDNCGDTWRPR